uniref:6-phosphofructo-2-kinase domain-containing protein n=1 Tax=Chrysotila carterae TaxID=13221 RepID=A0A7S4B7U4_CHRCT
MTPPAILASRSYLTPDSQALILATVGLPARGKSFIAHKLAAFLSWSGHRTNIFNAGQTRRRTITGEPEAKMERVGSAASFFDSSDAEAKALREQIAMNTLEELLEWFGEVGGIAIFDATNSNAKRRAAVVQRAEEASRKGGPQVSVVFIESVCDDANVLEANMLAKVRASPDFSSLDEEAALDDLRKRIAHYEAAYETVSDAEGAYIKLYNLSSKVTANQVFGRMSKSVLPFLLSLHVGERPVYLAALIPGMSGRASHDSVFTSRLTDWVRANTKTRSLRVLSSTQPAAIATATQVAAGGSCVVTQHSGLNSLDLGVNPTESLEMLSRMGFHERFDGGESFADLVRRLEPVLLEIEASMDPVLVLSHSLPCRALRAYFLGIEVASCMGAASSSAALALVNDSHSVVELKPRMGGSFSEEIHKLE